MPFIQQYMALDTLSNVLLSDIHIENIVTIIIIIILKILVVSSIPYVHVYMCANIYTFHHFLFL